MLIMTKTTEADAGCYKVVGTNDAGTAECLAWIAVFGKFILRWDMPVAYTWYLYGCEWSRVT